MIEIEDGENGLETVAHDAVHVDARPGHGPPAGPTTTDGPMVTEHFAETTGRSAKSGRH